MSQLYELCADTTMASDMRAASVIRHSDLSVSSNSPTSQEVRL